MTRIKSHAQWQTTDGTLIDENDRATGRRYYVYTCYTCYARLYRHISLCSQRSMREFWAFQILNKIVVFINGKIKRTSNVAFESIMASPVFHFVFI